MAIASRVVRSLERQAEEHGLPNKFTVSEISSDIGEPPRFIGSAAHLAIKIACARHPNWRVEYARRSETGLLAHFTIEQTGP